MPRRHLRRCSSPRRGSRAPWRPRRDCTRPPSCRPPSRRRSGRPTCRQRLLGRRKRRLVVLAARLLASERPEKAELVSVRTVCRGDFALADTGNVVFGPFLVPVAELRPPRHGAEGEYLLVDVDAQLRVRLDVIVVEATLEELYGVAELARDLLLLLYLGVKRLAGIGGRRGRSAGNRSGGEDGLENHRLKLHGIRSFP